MLKQWSVMQHQQPLGDVDTTIGVDPDQVVVESSMVDVELRPRTLSLCRLVHPGSMPFG
jgi:hypothetical protein